MNNDRGTSINQGNQPPLHYMEAQVVSEKREITNFLIVMGACFSSAACFSSDSTSLKK